MNGLPTNFSLDNGKITLTGGFDKAFDRLWMLSTFDLLRIYLPDYDTGIASLVQKNASYLAQNKMLILGRYQSLIKKYVPEIDATGMNIVQSFQNRKEYGIFVLATYIPTKEKGASIVFIG